jgi:hypothetical protein
MSATAQSKELKPGNSHIVKRKSKESSSHAYTYRF